MTTHTPRTPKQVAYYATLRKLTPEQQAEAYDRYNVPIPQRPSLSWLANHYNVSQSAMYRLLHEEKYNRTVAAKQPPARGTI